LFRYRSLPGSQFLRFAAIVAFTGFTLPVVAQTGEPSAAMIHVDLHSMPAAAPQGKQKPALGSFTLGWTSL
jgi:hypothetical protein